MWSYLWRTAQHGKDEALRMFTDHVLTLPIAAQSNDGGFATEVASVVDLAAADHAGVAAMLDVLRVEYQVEKPGNALSDFPSLDSEDFVREVKTRRPKGSHLSPPALKALRELYESEVPKILERRATILGHERTIAAAVHDAYGLTPDDLKLLRETAPPRMPPGW